MKLSHYGITMLLCAVAVAIMLIAGNGGVQGMAATVSQPALQQATANADPQIVEITSKKALDELFDRILAEEKQQGATAGQVDLRPPVFIEFYATWCGPCKLQAPIVEKVAPEFAGKIRLFVRIDIDKSPELAENFGVKAIPTHLVFLVTRGKVIGRHVGLLQEDQLREFLEKSLANVPRKP